MIKIHDIYTHMIKVTPQCNFITFLKNFPKVKVSLAYGFYKAFRAVALMY